MMFGVGRLLRVFGLFLIQPDAVIGEEILPEYRPFFDDLEKEYSCYKNESYEEILIFPGDRLGLRTYTENDARQRYNESLETEYKRYSITLYILLNF